MRKSKYIVIFLLLGIVNLFAAANRYEIKSGMVEYEIVGEGDISGTSVAISGTSKLYFKDFGNVELTDEKIQQTMMKETEEERTVSKIIADKVYTVDFTDEVIYTQKIVLDDEDLTFNVKNAEAFISMGAKKLGVEKILAYDCDVWQLGEDKIWVYNSVPLKLVTKSLGLIQIQEAKLAVFNITIKEEKFKLPPFPVRAMDEIIGDVDSEEISSVGVPEPEKNNKTIENLFKQSER
ncbi:MAG: hypothetical protein RBR65_02400 [Aliarcobacter sp.]|nr:hypothetical protein [Aliarcobacter sp.]